MTNYRSAEAQLLDVAGNVRNLLIERTTLQKMYAFYVNAGMREHAAKLRRSLDTAEDQLSTARQLLAEASMAYVHTLSAVPPQGLAEGLLNPLVFCEGGRAPECYRVDRSAAERLEQDG